MNSFGFFIVIGLNVSDLLFLKQQKVGHLVQHWEGTWDTCVLYWSAWVQVLPYFQFQLMCILESSNDGSKVWVPIIPVWDPYWVSCFTLQPALSLAAVVIWGINQQMECTFHFLSPLHSLFCLSNKRIFKIKNKSKQNRKLKHTKIGWRVQN